MSTFAATGVSADVVAPADGELTFSTSGTFVASLVLEVSHGGNRIAWQTIATYKKPVSGQITARAGNVYRLRCASYTSGTVTYSLAAPGVTVPGSHPLPTSAAGLASGAFWNNAGVINVVP